MKIYNKFHINFTWKYTNNENLKKIVTALLAQNLPSGDKEYLKTLPSANILFF